MLSPFNRSNSSRLGFRNFNDAHSQASELVKAARDWFPPEKWDIAKTYANRKVYIVMHCRLVACTGKYDLVFSPIPHGADGRKRTSAGKIDEGNVLNVDSRLHDSSMLACVRTLVKCPQRSIPSLVWLEPSKQRFDVIGHMLALRAECGLKFRYCVSEGKVGSLSELSRRNSARSVVKSESKILHRLNRETGNRSRHRGNQDKFVNELSSFDVVLTDSLIRVTSKMRSGNILQFEDIILCPADAFVGTRKGFSHDETRVKRL